MLKRSVVNQQKQLQNLSSNLVKMQKDADSSLDESTKRGFAHSQESVQALADAKGIYFIVLLFFTIFFDCILLSLHSSPL